MCTSLSRLLLFIIFWPGVLNGQTERAEIQRLKSILDTCTHAEIEVQVLNDLAWEYYYSDYDSSYAYVNQALALSEQLDDKYWQSVSLEMKAILKDLSGQVEEALKLYLEVIPLRESIGGVGLETTYNNMAVIFRNQENYEKALKYFTISYELEKSNNNIAGIAGSLNNLALCQLKLEKLDSVAFYLHRSIALANKVSDQIILTSAYLNLADYHFQEAQIDSARLFYQRSLKNGNEIEDYGAIAVARFGLAELEFNERNYNRALQQIDSAEYYGRRLHSLLYQQRAHRLKAEVLAEGGRFQEAYEQFSLYDAVKDSLAKNELIQITNGLEAKYESERKERQIAELELDSIAQELDAESSRNERNLLLSVTIIMILVLGFILQRFLTQRKNSRILSEKNDLVESALKDRETLLREIHHRVKNNLQVVSSLLSIQGREIKDDRALQAVNDSRNRVKSMALIHQFLYGEQHLSQIDMREYFSQLCNSLFDTYQVDQDHVEVVTEIEHILLDVDTAVPLGLITNELITNALKYAFPDKRKGKLSISLGIEDGCLMLKVGDNGVGVEGEVAKSSSFGMKLLKAFQQKLDADFKIVNDDGLKVSYKIRKYTLS